MSSKPRKYSFTLKDVAHSTGLSIHTVRLYARSKVFKPDSLISTALFVAGRIMVNNARNK